MTTICKHSTSIDERTWPQAHLFGMSLDALTIRSTVDVIHGWVTEPYSRCRYVVTPNIDHVVMFQQHQGLRAAYGEAALVLADGWPVVTASHWLGQPLPERVPGSDLVPLLLKTAPAEDHVRVFLLGAAPGVGLRAAENIQRRWPHVRVEGIYSPPLGFEKDYEENQRILQLIEQAEPDLLVVGLGAPKQELWVHAHRDRLHAKVALCVGATIDFLAGEKARAPRWMRRMRLEWLHRLLSEPRRLAKRYARDAWVFPQLVWGEWRRRTKLVAR